VSRGSLQMAGAYGLALARELGADRSLTRHVGDRATYFNVSGAVIVQYGPAVALALALLASALLAAAHGVGLRHGRLTLRGLVLGADAYPAALVLNATVATAAWMLVVKPAVPDLQVLSIGTSENAFFVLGVVALGFALFAALYAPLVRRARPENLALGALAWWVVAGVALTLLSPSAAYLFVLPALAAAAVALWRLRAPRDGAWQWALGVTVPLAVLVVVYAPVMLLFAVLALRLEGMGAPALGLMALFAALAAGLFVPFLHPHRRGRSGVIASRWLAPAGAALLALSLIGIGARRLDASETAPRPDHLAYVLDADTGRASFEAGDTTSWSAPLLQHAKRADIAIGLFSTFPGWRAPATAVDLPGPRVVESGRTRDGATTTLRLRLTSPRGADAAAIHLRTPGVIAAASVQGRRIDVNQAMRDGELELEYVGLPRRGIELVVSVRGTGTLHATTRDVTQGLPAGLVVPARPADSTPSPLSFRADPTIVSSKIAIDLAGGG
jgi:MFS family permease